MDLTKFTTDDLVALKAGDLSLVSTQGLQLLRQEAFNAKVAAQQEQDRKTYDPTVGMSGTEKFLAGAGKAVSDLGLGVRQMFGNASQAEVDEAARRDAPLMKTGAGVAGNVTGAIGAAVPAMFIPGANTVAGAGVIGAAQGALSPTVTGESTGRNMLVGGALGSGGVAAGKALGVLYGAGKGLVEPFTQGGRERIVGRTLERFQTNPGAVAAARGTPTVTGAVPTLAEATKDTGIASLQRAVEQLDPAAAAMAQERSMANNAARVKTLEGIAGGPQARAAAEQARADASGKLYAASDAKTATLDGGFAKLMDRPAFAAAVQNAENLAKNEGVGSIFVRGVDGQPVGITGQGAHYVKKALDDMADKTSASYMGNAAAAASGKTQKAFLSWLDNQIPEYAQAADAFAQASKPINAMDVGQRLLDKTSSATRDLSGNRRMQANAFAKALNDEEQLIRLGTGTKAAGNSLSDVMTPDQMTALNAIRNELELSANLAQAANGPGSQTAKSLASQNLLRQVMGPTGLPQSWTEGLASSALAESLLRPAQFVLKAPEARITEKLGQALMNPDVARAALAAANRSPKVANALADVLPIARNTLAQSLPASRVVARERREENALK